MIHTNKDVGTEVRQLIKKRGPLKYDVWSGYASKGKIKFALNSSPIVLLLILLESDPLVAEYTLTQLAKRKAGEPELSTDPDAVCITESGDIEWMALAGDLHARSTSGKSSGVVAPPGILLKTIDGDYLIKNQIRLQNWSQGLCYLHSALDYDLTPNMQSIQSILGVEQPVRLGHILSAFNDVNKALLIAAMFELAQRGKIVTNLSEKRLGLDTSIWRPAL